MTLHSSVRQTLLLLSSVLVVLVAAKRPYQEWPEAHYSANGYGYDGTPGYQERSVVLGPYTPKDRPEYPEPPRTHLPTPARPRYPPQPHHPAPYVPSSVSYHSRPQSAYDPPAAPAAPVAHQSPQYPVTRPYPHAYYNPESHHYKAERPTPYAEYYGEPSYEYSTESETLWRQDTANLVRYDRHAFDS